MPIKPLPEGIQLLELDPDKIKKIWGYFSSISGILDDLVKDNFERFCQKFYSMDTIWLELKDGNGLLYATDVIPHLSASVHFVYWDRKLSGREAMSLECLQWLMEVADLHKVNAWIPDFCKVAHKFAERLGFKREARIRDWSYSQGRLYDVLCFGMTKEEVFNGRVYDSGERYKHTENTGVRTESVAQTVHAAT